MGESDLHSNDDNPTSPATEGAVSDDAIEANEYNVSDDNHDDKAPANPDDDVEEANAALSAPQEHQGNLSDDEEYADLVLQRTAEEKQSNADDPIDGEKGEELNETIRSIFQLHLVMPIMSPTTMRQCRQSNRSLMISPRHHPTHSLTRRRPGHCSMRRRRRLMPPRERMLTLCAL